MSQQGERKTKQSVCLLVLSSSKSFFFCADVFRGVKSVCEMTHTEKEKATFYYSCEIIRRSLFFFFFVGHFLKTNTVNTRRLSLCI